MSLAVSPSPRPLSGSLLTIVFSTKPAFGSQMSWTATLATMSRSLWLGGQSEVGSTEASIVGAWVSATVTLVAQFEVFPESSMTVNVTGVTPRGKNPGALLVGARDGSQMSLAETPAKKAASWGSFLSIPLLPVHSTTTGPGQLIAGAVVSWTLTWKLQ